MGDSVPWYSDPVAWRILVGVGVVYVLVFIAGLWSGGR